MDYRFPSGGRWSGYSKLSWNDLLVEFYNQASKDNLHIHVEQNQAPILKYKALVYVPAFDPGAKYILRELGSSGTQVEASFFEDGQMDKALEFGSGLLSQKIIIGPSTVKSNIDVKSPEKKTAHRDDMKLLLFKAIERIGEKVNNGGILKFQGQHSSKDVDVFAESGTVFQTWAKLSWEKTNPGKKYNSNELLINSNLPGFSVKNLLNFYKRNCEK